MQYYPIGKQEFGVIRRNDFVLLLGLGFDAELRNVKTAKWQRAV